MAISTIFNNNRTQAVRLPAEMRFPDSVKKVEVRVAGQERIMQNAKIDPCLAWSTDVKTKADIASSKLS